MRSIQKLRSKYFPLYCIATMKMSVNFWGVLGNFWKTDEISVEAQFYENYTKTLSLKIRKIFGKSSVSSW